MVLELFTLIYDIKNISLIINCSYLNDKFKSFILTSINNYIQNFYSLLNNYNRKSYYS